MIDCLCLLKQILDEDDSCIVAKIDILNWIQTWGEFIYTERVTGEYWPLDKENTYKKNLITLAKRLGYRTPDTTLAESYGFRTPTEEELQEHDFKCAEAFMNIYFNEENFYWGIDKSSNSYGYFPVVDRYSITLTAIPDKGMDMDRSNNIVLDYLGKQPYVIETVPNNNDYAMVLNMEIETDDIEETREKLASMLGVVGFTKVFFEP